MSVETVLAAQRGLIVAPAGCGKTHLIYPLRAAKASLLGIDTYYSWGRSSEAKIEKVIRPGITW